LKIRVPYQSLQGHVNRLHKLQQASDVLRRISRFLILARRLELQMAELNRPLDISIDTPTEPTKSAGASYEELGDEKERTIAKAALTIAELSW
jgi:conserved oligomeric Golgi complex subunit 5